MPPEAAHCRHNSIPTVSFSRPISPTEPAFRNLITGHKIYRGTVRNVTRKRIILILVFILTSFSVLRLLRILLVSTTFSSARLSVFSLNSRKSDGQGSLKGQAIKYPDVSILTEKEFSLLKKTVSSIAPCNLLVFGLQPQFLILSSINTNGTTIFLEHDQDMISATGANSNGIKVYKVEHKSPVKDAYKLLKHARRNKACTSSWPPEESKCTLAMRDLPKHIYHQRWDVILIDGPSGHSLDAPGRMSAIYTASVLARSGNRTNVIVHDIDRMIERWFSWEFLCEENLVSSKGKLWNFMITGQKDTTGLCSIKTVKNQ